jgi:hypothetical protein
MDLIYTPRTVTVQATRLWRTDGGVGQTLVDDAGNVVGTMADVWRGKTAAPVGCIFCGGGGRYPTYWLKTEA